MAHNAARYLSLLWSLLPVISSVALVRAIVAIWPLSRYRWAVNPDTTHPERGKFRRSEVQKSYLKTFNRIR